MGKEDEDFLNSMKKLDRCIDPSNKYELEELKKKFPRFEEEKDYIKIYLKNKFLIKERGELQKKVIENREMLSYKEQLLKDLPSEIEEYKNLLSKYEKELKEVQQKISS